MSPKSRNHRYRKVVSTLCVFSCLQEFRYFSVSAVVWTVIPVRKKLGAGDDEGVPTGAVWYKLWTSVPLQKRITKPNIYQQQSASFPYSRAYDAFPWYLLAPGLTDIKSEKSKLRCYCNKRLSEGVWVFLDSHKTTVSSLGQEGDIY